MIAPRLHFATTSTVRLVGAPRLSCVENVQSLYYTQVIRITTPGYLQAGLTLYLHPVCPVELNSEELARLMLVLLKARTMSS